VPGLRLGRRLPGMPYDQSTSSIADRIAALPWDQLRVDLDSSGYTVARGLLTPSECRDIRALYAAPEHFRSRIVMERYNFGRGEYQYFEYPLPPLVRELREAAYPYLAKIASGWSERLATPANPARVWPSTLRELTAACHDAGQVRPTPLLLKYGEGDYNCLHQDLYGDLVFPLQLAVLLDGAGDFEGGEFVLTEQRPRMQSRVEVVHWERGDAVIFAVRERPVHGTRGDYRVQLRHGVSRITRGARHTLGVIFHDAS
jgi:uncharacterized protein